jgi:hypothetical protein
VRSQPDIHHTYSGGILGTNTSGFLGSGAYLYSDGEMYETGCTLKSNEQGDVTHSPIYYINSGIDLVTNISSFQCSGTFVSSHLENIPIQDANTTRASPSLFIPSYSYLSLTPSNDPSESPLMQQIRMTDGKPFEVYIGKFFTYLDYQVWYTKLNGDYGADLFIERDGVCIVVSYR